MKNQRLKKKLMRLTKSRQAVQHLFPFLVIIVSLTVSGCAKKPWGNSLAEKEYEAGLHIAEELFANSTECSKGFQSDLSLEYSNPLGKRTLSGFLMYSPGPNYKFVVSNPLGQPIVIIAGNQKKYEMINTLDSKFVSGGMTSFALRYKLPIHFLKGRWDDWLTAKNTIESEYITNISDDKRERGIWVTVEDKSGAKNISHLLIDPQKKIILERRLETNQNKPIGTISYSDFYLDQSCSQPQTINITGLEYGTTINLRLAETELNSHLIKYKLKAPKGYLRQYRP